MNKIRVTPMAVAMALKIGMEAVYAESVLPKEMEKLYGDLEAMARATDPEFSEVRRDRHEFLSELFNCFDELFYNGG